METNLQVCQNCKNTLPTEAKYCPSCSQKVKSGKVTIREFIQDFFDTVFNLDSKLFQTLGSLFIPGKLTKEYFEGKRKSYASPVRLFLIIMILFLTLINYTNQNNEQNTDVIQFGKEKEVERRVANWMEKAKQKLILDTIFEGSSFEILDTFIVRYENERYTKNQTHVFYSINFEEKSIDKKSIPAEDIANLAEEEFLEKYEFEGFINKILASRIKKVAKDPDALNRFLLSSLTWMGFLFLPFMGLILKMLYRRQDKYFIEHLIFLFHVHSFIILVFSLVILLQFVPSMIRKAMGIGMIVYFILAFKNVYQQGWGKTISKIILFLFSYILGLFFFMLLFVFVGFLIF